MFNTIQKNVALKKNTLLSYFPILIGATNYFFESITQVKYA